MSTESNSNLDLDKSPLRKSTLLLVDDKPENLIALAAVLAGPQYHLISANSGEEALELLEKNEVDLILLDIQMPGMDGYETARKIKQMERYQNTPIIFITAIFTENPHIKKGYQAGAIDYFTKPFDPDNFWYRTKRRVSPSRPGRSSYPLLSSWLPCTRIAPSRPKFSACPCRGF